MKARDKKGRFVSSSGGEKPKKKGGIEVAKRIRPRAIPPVELTRQQLEALQKLIHSGVSVFAL
jgi:hypothetical protein